ncbi:MAG: hypothetical protein AAF371_12905 [Pseudomonadota bacterium]
MPFRPQPAATQSLVALFALGLIVGVEAPAAEAGCTGASAGLTRAACLGSSAETTVLLAPLRLVAPAGRSALPAATYAPRLSAMADPGRILPVVDAAVMRRELRDVSVPPAPRFEDGAGALGPPAAGLPANAYTPFLPSRERATVPRFGLPAD